MGIVQWAASFFKGNGGMLLAAGLAGMGVGAWTAATLKDAGEAGKYRELADKAARTADESAGALITLVQNAGRREMNYLFSHEAERRQFSEALETFRTWDAMSVEAKKAANARGEKLMADMRAQSAKYEQLVKSYENADETVSGWLRGKLPADLCIVRYGAEACRADPFAAAGYPATPNRPPAVAKPPG